MRIVALTFDCFEAKKDKPIKAPIDIKTDVLIKDIKKEEFSSEQKKESLLRFDFEFKVNYNPEVAHILIGGHILFKDKEKELKNILDEWKNSKRIPPELMERVLNIILLKSNIKALLLGQEVGLPPHIRLPIVTRAPQADMPARKQKKQGKAKEKPSNYMG